MARRYFRDPDGDALTHAAGSGRSGIVRTSVPGSIVILTPITDGTATVTLPPVTPAD